MGLWNSLSGLFTTKQAKIEKKPDKPNHGASWNNPGGVKNPYRNALPAYGNHGYLYAAINRACEDLSALDLRLVKGRGREAKEIFEHPVLDLLNQPSSDVDGFLLREQILLDLILSGSCYCVMLGLKDQPTSVIRLHPDEVQVVTNELGIIGYEHTSSGKSVIYPPERILTARNASYAKGSKALYGTGSVEALRRELTSDLNVQDLTSQQSKQKHPSVLLSPKDSTDIWPQEVRRQISDNYARLSTAGGCLVLSGQTDVTPLSLSAKDMEYQAVRKLTMEVISSVIGTPGSVLGLPSTNYATSRNQAINYWELQKKRGKRIAIMLSKLAKLWDKDLYIEHDFSSVEPLQSVRDAQLARVRLHIENGISPAEAYSYEGMSNAPIGPNARPEDEEVAIINEEEEKTLLRLFSSATEKRKMVWKAFLATRHGPTERKFKRAYMRYLKDARDRYVSRFDENTSAFQGRSVSGSVHLVRAGESFIDVLDWNALESKDIEKRKLKQAVGDIYRKNYKAIGQEELDRVMKKAGLDRVDFAEKGGQALVDLMAKEITHTTVKKIRKAVEKGRDEGKSKAEIRDDIKRSVAFDEARANLIARTESTRSINKAINDSYIQAEKAGVKLTKTWITEDDDRVRPSHQELDGQTVPVNGLFVTTGGATSDSPGNFGIEDEDCNCRCTIEALVTTE